MRNFTTSQVLALLSGFDASPVDLAKRVHYLLEGLIEIGFHSARFYSKVESGAEVRSDVIQLIDYAYRVGPSRPLAGIKIPFATTTIFRHNHIKQGFSIGEPTHHRDLDWPNQIEVGDTYWIDLLIANTSTDEVYGLLAVSWSGSRDLLNDDGISALRLMASRVATWISQRSDHIVKLRETLEETFVLDEATGQLNRDTVAAMLGFFQQAFNADCSACFRYDFLQGELSKLSEIAKGDVAGQALFPEAYLVGQYLTGKAFIRDDLCFIPDFLHFAESDIAEVFSESLKYHQERIGGIASCLYGRISFGCHRYLVRLFRSPKSESKIFSKKDRDDLRTACDNLSSRLEREVREFQHVRILRAATEGIKKLVESGEGQTELAQYFDAASLGPVLVAVQESTDSICEVEFASGIFSKPQVGLEWETSPLAAIVSSNEIFGRIKTVQISDIGFPQRSILQAQVGEARFDQVCLLAVKGVSAKITLVFVRAGQPGSISDERVGISTNEEGFLLSLLAIYAAASEAKKSLITADKADHMLADLGHEVGTPISILTQTAILACDLSIDAIRAIAGQDTGALGTIRDLEEKKLEVNDLGGLVQIVTEIPRALAQLGNNQIEMDFQAHDWSALVSDIWDDAIDWSKVWNGRDLGLGRVARGQFVLKTSENMKGRFVVGDRSFLRLAIGNVVKNALKYSLPRFRGFPMEVGMFLEPQPDGNFTYLNIRNWGVGIKPDNFRRVFRKYERIDRRDRKRIIPGRGIGLYLAKAFMQAHEGDIVCRASRSTLDDQTRVQALEGFETVFRISIPTVAQTGKRMARFQ